MSEPRERDPFTPVAEEDAIPSKRFWLAGAVAGVVVVVSVLVAGRILHATEGAPSAEQAAAPPMATAARNEIGIVEQTLIRTTRRGLDEREAQRETLRHYRWVDRAHGVAGVPIERAMDLVTDPGFMRRAFERPDARPSSALQRDGGP